MSPKEFREVRDKLGLTQRELSEILGLSGYIPVNHYESGFRTPSVLIQSLMRILVELPDKKSLELRETLKEHNEFIRKHRRKKSK